MRYSKNGIIRIASILGFLVLWQMIGTVNQTLQYMNPSFLPTPTKVLATGVEYFNEGTLFPHIWASLERVLKGFLIGTGLSIVIGYFMAKDRVLFNVLDPVFGLISSVPAYAFMPLLIIWFGIGENAKIILIVYSTFMPMLGYTIQGVKNIDPLLIRSAKSLGANEWQVFTHVIIKSAIPYIFNGMKVSLGLTFSALIIAEMMGADKGLGYIIINGRNWFLVADMFLSMTLIALLYTVLKQILVVMENWLCRWKKSGTDAIE